METTEIQVLMQAIAQMNQNYETLANQYQAIQQQNQDLQTSIRERLNTIPLEMKQILNAFTTQLIDIMEGQKSDKMHEAIKQLTATMDNLIIRLEDSSMVQLQVNDQVMTAYEEIMLKTNSPNHSPQISPESSKSGLPIRNGTKP
jgi:lipopolysaccharide biosynthesis regulator YciM